MVLAALAVGVAEGGDSVAQGPEKVLSQEFGLIRRGKSEVWITPREAALRRQLDELPPLVERVRAERDWIADARSRNLLLWPQRQAREAALKKALRDLPASDPKRKPLESELKNLDRTAVPPEKLGAAPWVQPRLVDLASGLNAILLGVVQARRDAEKLKSEYDTLGQNSDVHEALEKLGGGHRLGPLREYTSDLRRVDECEQFAFAHSPPLYYQSGHLRIGAVLDERMPVTFTWRESSEPAVITAGIAQAAGIVPGAEAPEMSIGCGGSRRLPAKRVMLKTLRFGKHVLRDVEAWLLPPEGEDFGCRIGAASFTGFQIAPEPALLRFRIDPAK
jgi:hypothetical protein